MTQGSPHADDPIDALHELSDALAELVTAARRVAQTASAALDNPEAREAIAAMLTLALDAVTAAAGGGADPQTAEPGPPDPAA